MSIPTPKYEIGQTVFYASHIAKTKSHPCPDCLGSGEWSVTTPAGSIFAVACKRCIAYKSDRDLSLQYEVHVPLVRNLTIGSVQINTAAYKPSEVIAYMCLETGVGSGSIYYEPNLFATERESETASNDMCEVHNAKNAATPERVRFAHLHLSDLRFKEAVLRGESYRRSEAEQCLSEIREMLQPDESNEGYTIEGGNEDYTADSELREKLLAKLMKP